jgi:Tfp pilus assembly protein PilO
MPSFTRKKLVRAIQSAAVAVLALDLVVYLAVVRPLSNTAADEQRRFVSSRQGILRTQASIAQLQRELTLLPATDKDLQEFLDQHVAPRRRGYSRAAGLVHQLTQDSQVNLKQVAYRLESDPKEPLERLGIQVNVEGPFESLLHFTHALETSSDFLLVRGVIIQPGESGGLSLRLLAELYVIPQEH